MKLYFYEAYKNGSSVDFILEKNPLFTWQNYCAMKEPEDPNDYQVALRCVKQTYEMAQLIARSIPFLDLAPMKFWISATDPKEIRPWTIFKNCRMEIMTFNDLVTGIIDFSVPVGTPLRSWSMLLRIANDMIYFRHGNQYIKLSH